MNKLFLFPCQISVGLRRPEVKSTGNGLIAAKWGWEGAECFPADTIVIWTILRNNFKNYIDRYISTKECLGDKAQHYVRWGYFKIQMKMSTPPLWKRNPDTKMCALPQYVLFYHPKSEGWLTTERCPHSAQYGVECRRCPGDNTTFCGD